MDHWKLIWRCLHIPLGATTSGFPRDVVVQIAGIVSPNDPFTWNREKDGAKPAYTVKKGLLDDFNFWVEYHFHDTRQPNKPITFMSRARDFVFDNFYSGRQEGLIWPIDEEKLQNSSHNAVLGIVCLQFTALIGKHCH